MTAFPDELRNKINAESKANRDRCGLPPMYFGFEGEPLELGDWCVANELTEENKERKIVAQTELDNGWFVLTVWIGIDHLCFLVRSDEPPKPRIFETVVFPGSVLCERYTSRVSALAGHDQIVEEFKRRESPGEEEVD